MCVYVCIYIYDIRRDDMGLGVAALDVCAGVFAMLGGRKG